MIACHQERRIDSTNVKIELNILCFDEDLSKINPSKFAIELPALKKKYGSFYDDYFQKILNLGTIQDTQYYETLRQVLKGKAFQDLQQETDSIYPNLDVQKPHLEVAFKNIKALYPTWKVPKLVTYISGFQVQTPIGSGYVGIGLDMFLGKDSKFYPALVESIPRYISRRFTPENITPRVVEVVTREDLFPELDQDKSLLSKMIYNGKLLYFMKQVQPDEADSTLIGYSKQQIKWANQFESDTWAFFLEQNLLFDTDYMKIQKYLAEAPFTPGFGTHNDSAPKLGVFIGWQIVKNYMEKNNNITLKELMLEKDVQKILRLAKYHPDQKGDSK